MTRRQRIAVLLLACCAAAGLWAVAPADAAGEDAAPQGNYANTPDEYVPFSRFVKPYKRHFLEKLEYRGYGRMIPEPDHVDSVKIGFLGPVEETVSVATGGASHDTAMGIMMLRGARLAVERANAAGGYRGTGIPYELVVRNDNGLWGASGEEIIRFAYQDRVWAVYGTIDGANSHIAIRAALKIELPVMNCADTDPTYSETAIPWAFRCITDDRQMCYLLADYAFGKLGLTRVVALRSNSRYARLGIAKFRDAAVRVGHPLLAELSYEMGERDFTTLLDRAEALRPEAIITYGNAAESALILRQMRNRGMDQWLIGSDRMVSPEFFAITGDNVERVAAAYPYDPGRSGPGHEAFREAFTARFQEQPEIFAAHAYDGMNMIISAVERGGLNRAKIRDELAAMKTYRGVTGEKRFDATYNNISPPFLAIAEGGRFSFHSWEEVIR